MTEWKPAPKRKQFSFRNDPCCLVLGAGGARGLSHLGVLRAIAEAKIQVDTMIGASMGSLMASLCAVERDPRIAAERTIEFLSSTVGRKIRAAVLGAGSLSQDRQKRRWGNKLFSSLKRQAALSRAIHSRSLLPSTILRDAIDHLIPDIDIRDVSIDLQIIAVDLERGQRIVLREGSLRRAIRASMSIPGIFPAVRFNEMQLNDIGNYDTVPCDIVKIEQRYPGKLIAIDVGPCPDQASVCHSALDAMVRASNIAETIIRQRSLTLADLVIRPEFSGKQWYEFQDLQAIIESGYSSAQQALASLQLQNV